MRRIIWGGGPSIIPAYGSWVAAGGDGGITFVVEAEGVPLMIAALRVLARSKGLVLGALGGLEPAGGGGGLSAMLLVVRGAKLCCVEGLGREGGGDRKVKRIALHAD